MKYTKTNTKKPYTSPEFSIHELSVESVCVTGTAQGQPWGAPQYKRIEFDDEDDLMDCHKAEFYDGELIY